uniref:Salivary lipocalin n=1 Tax=Panstrongylus lignarius TaxID=156445 RepID=A0A224Y035_9HEMI
MKTIIAVTIFGILTCAYATDGDNCVGEKAMADFDAAQFFNGSWYLAHEAKTKPTVCQKFSTNETEGFANIVESGYDKFKEFTKFQCEGGKKNEEQYSFNCSSYECGSDNINFKVDFTFISADYNNFVLVCRSITIGAGPKEDKFIVLERTKDEHVTDAKDIC